MKTPPKKKAEEERGSESEFSAGEKNSGKKFEKEISQKGIGFLPCQHVGCLGKGEFVGIICIPPTGWAKDEKTCLKTEVGLPLCGEHVKEIIIEDFLTEEVKEVFLMQLHSMYGRKIILPDWKRAWLVRGNAADFHYLFKEIEPETRQ